MQATMTVAGASPGPPPGGLPDFEQVFLAHHERVLRAAFRIAGNMSDAEDVLQTVFLRLMRNSNDLTAVGDVGNYLYRAGINAAVDLVRSRKHDSGLSTDDMILPASGDPAWDPARLQESSELGQWLRHAVSQLHPTAAEMFVLRYFEGYENPEIARMMDTSEGTVAVTLHRTRTRLQNDIRSAFGGRRQ